MNRYIHGGICAAIGAAKATIIKALNWQNCKITLLNLFSPMTEISLDRGGVLVVGKMLKMRSGAKLRIRKNAHVEIGNNFSMSNHCILVSRDSITVGNNVELGPGVLIYDHDHDYCAEGGLAAEKYKISPVTIGNNVWIGANSVVLRGTKIGDNCVIAAGSILRGSYPADSMIYQEKCTKVKQIQERA